MDIFGMLNSTTAAVVTLVSAIVGVGGSFYYWTQGAKARRIEEDNSESKIKKLLGEEIDFQNKKIARLQIQADDSNVEINKLKANQTRLEQENISYTKIFQGRDDDALKYREEGRESMRQTRENGRMLADILKHMDKIYDLLAVKFQVEGKVEKVD